ncbi:hypothetical protein BSLA_03f1664 [Burkholderia stabilis]|nr:hypothetical protein BSLA_03f1664 [Burkholderia stabilis]
MAGRRYPARIDMRPQFFAVVCHRTTLGECADQLSMTIDDPIR